MLEMEDARNIEVSWLTMGDWNTGLHLFDFSSCAMHYSPETIAI